MKIFCNRNKYFVLKNIFKDYVQKAEIFVLKIYFVSKNIVPDEMSLSKKRNKGKVTDL